LGDFQHRAKNTLGMTPHPISRVINAERIVLLGWSRAILLQLAHPLVAAGVAEHSTFREGRLAAAVRLHHTVRAMLALTFGDERSRTAAVEGIKAIHRRVHGHLPSAAGTFPAGTWYSAEDPELVLWVHATLLDSVPMIYDLTVAPLAVGDRDAYCAQAAPLAVDLGARDADVPRTWRALQDYLSAMYGSGRIAVSGQAREIASAVVAPPLAFVLGPVTWANRLVTEGLLPPAVRSGYGAAWNEDRERALRRTIAAIRRLRRWTPPALALWPEARSRQ